MNTISYWLYNDSEIDSHSENYISNIINYHIERLNLHDQPSKNTLEVQILKNPDNKIYPIFKKKDTEKTIKYPILSCMVFLTDCELPFVITEIDIDSYKYKEFKKQDTLHVIFPKKNTHVVFHGSVCNGFIIPNSKDADINDKNRINAIVINVWESETEITKPMITTEEIENETTSEFIPLNNQIIWTNDFLTYNMFNNLLYMKNYTHEDVNIILELYNKYLQQNWYVIKKSEINLKNVHLNTCENTYNNNRSNFNNRFLQRFHIKNFLSPNTCDWLINSAIKNDTNISFSHDQSYIHMMENNEIKSFTITMLETVCDEINKSYNINVENIENNTNNNTNNKIEITDVLLVKYDNNNTKKNGIKMYSNTDHDITAEIMLSLLEHGNNNSREGQLMFNDGLHVILNQGDMVIYSNLTQHNINKISSENTVLYKIIIHMKINKD
jgi:hypothetical protein